MSSRNSSVVRTNSKLRNEIQSSKVVELLNDQELAAISNIENWPFIRKIEKITNEFCSTVIPNFVENFKKAKNVNSCKTVDLFLRKIIFKSLILQLSKNYSSLDRMLKKFRNKIETESVIDFAEQRQFFANHIGESCHVVWELMKTVSFMFPGIAKNNPAIYSKIFNALKSEVMQFWCGENANWMYEVNACRSEKDFFYYLILSINRYNPNFITSSETYVHSIIHRDTNGFYARYKLCEIDDRFDKEYVIQKLYSNIDAKFYERIKNRLSSAEELFGRFRLRVPTINGNHVMIEHEQLSPDCLIDFRIEIDFNFFMKIYNNISSLMRKY